MNASLTFLHGTHEVLSQYNKIMLLCVLSGSKPLARLLEAYFGTYNGQRSIAL